MNTPVVQRLLAMAFTIWLAATLAFFALRALPGDAIATQLAESGASQATIDERREMLGLNDPILAQYGRFIAGLVQGDLGYSLLDGLPVSELILQQAGPTAALAAGATIAATLLGLTLGVVGATNFTRGLSAGARAAINLALSVPIYWTGMLVIFASTLLPPNPLLEQTSLFVLPAVVLGFHASGAIARVVQVNLRDTLSADFVRAARAKGLPERAVLGRHVLRVVLPSIIVVIAVQAGFLLSGTVITESLFHRPGIGQLLLTRTIRQDYPVVQGVVILAATTYTLINTCADLLQRRLDPRLGS